MQEKNSTNWLPVEITKTGNSSSKIIILSKKYCDRYEIEVGEPGLYIKIKKEKE